MTAKRKFHSKLNKRSLISKDVGDSVFKVLIFAILIVYAASILFLLAWGLLTSFKSNFDYSGGNLFGLPDSSKFKPNENWFSNYRNALKQFTGKFQSHYFVGNREVDNYATHNFWTMLGNSVIYAGLGAIVQAIVPAVVAYVCVKYKFRFSKILYAVTLFIYIIPIVGNTPTMITTLRNLGLYDSFLGHIALKFNFTGMYFFVYWAFFESLPDSYLEAAEIDGASQLRTLTSVVLPLASKTIATVALIMFVQYWNDYQTPLLYLPTHPTVAFGVYFVEYINRGAAQYTPEKIACYMMLALPVLLIFIFFKDKLMGNISMGGIKE